MWQEKDKHFVCRIKGKTKKKCIERKDINPDSNIFYDAIVLLGTPGTNQRKKPVRLVGYIWPLPGLKSDFYLMHTVKKILNKLLKRWRGL